MSYGDDNPLFTDFEYGKATRWNGQIAPGMIINCLGNVTYGDPMPEEIRLQTREPFSGIHVFVSGQSTEWYRPTRPGDELYSFGGTESVKEKKSEFAGRSVIRVHRTVRVNQRAEIVAINRMLSIVIERKGSRERGKYMDIEPASYTDEDLKAIDEVYAAERRPGARPRYFEDVEVGEELPTMAKGPFNAYRRDLVPRRRLPAPALRMGPVPAVGPDPPAHPEVLHQGPHGHSRRGAAAALG